MNKNLIVSPEDISSIFIKYLQDKNVIFVFSTDVVMNSWIDWCIMNPEKSGTSVLPLERFTAWDKFKSQYISDTTNTEIQSIPSLLKKFFIQDLLSRNSEKPFLKKIINPEYAENANSFTDWLTKILPSLKLWYTLRTKAENILSEEEIAKFNFDEEEQDFFELYRQYTAFLNKNKMFEPAWITPNFSKTGQKFIIFYPELLEDYADFKQIFENCEDIILINLPEIDSTTPGPECLKFSDSRKELRRTMLKIRELVQSGTVKWEQIALSVPKLSSYRPYLEREFTKYCIPYVIKAGFPLTSNCAGIIFQEINDCYSNNFSYDSVRSLLLNEFIPWKTNISQTKENLIRDGQELRCLCSYEKSENNSVVDVWQEALNATSNTNELERNLYNTLKEDITSICEASSFSNIQTAWEIFKNHFLEASDFTKDANNILSRCIVHLKELATAEEDFVLPLNLHLENHFNFFLNEINSKSYTPQTELCGVNVFDYSLSSAANFEFQFVIDASQSNLEKPNKRLDFLSSEKRKLLNLEEEDKYFNASKAFIRLYAKGNHQFSYAEDSFNGFAIAHNFFTVNEDNKEPLCELDEQDFILAEEKLFLENKIPENPKFSKAQKEQFEKWLRLRKINQNNLNKEDESYKSYLENLKERINFIAAKNRHSENLCITQSDLSQFFPCPRNWIFSSIFKLGEDSLDTELISNYEIGKINHKILELFFHWCKNNNNSKLPCIQPETNSFENEDEIFKVVKDITLDVLQNGYNLDFAKSPLSKYVLLSQSHKFSDSIFSLLKEFCLSKEDKGFGNFTVSFAEKWLTAEPENTDYIYGGQLDCVLTDEKNNIYIIDFKTSSTPAIKDCKEDKQHLLNDFQIAMYVTLWNKTYENSKAENALFYSINNRKKSFVLEKKDDSKTTSTQKTSTEKNHFGPTLAVFEEYTELFGQKVMNQNLEPDFNSTNKRIKVDKFQNCQNCAYKNICRSTYSIQ